MAALEGDSRQEGFDLMAAESRRLRAAASERVQFSQIVRFVNNCFDADVALGSCISIRAGLDRY